MKFSVSETIKYIVAEVHRTKEKDPASPITIISPNISMIHSINRALLEAGRPLLNVRIETFYQYVKRHTEPTLLNQGLPTLTTEQSNLFIQEILARTKLKYFHAAKDFSSYTRYFLKTINELRTSVPQSSLRKALQNLGEKGEELFWIFDKYLTAKKSLADYADMLELWPGSDERLILFPGVEKELTLMEKDVLGRIESVFRAEKQPPVTGPAIELRNPLSPVQEVKDVFRQLLELSAPFDRTAIVSPSDYLALVMEEAENLNIPVFCPHGEEMLLDQIEIFKSALEVLHSDYDYQALKRFFQLKGHFAPISALIECGVAVGGDLLKEAANRLYQEKKKDRLLKLCTFIGAFNEIENLKDQPHEMGEAIIEHFIPKSRQSGILKAILEDMLQLTPDADYETWETLLLERLTRIRAKSDHREKSVFLSTDFLPGSFDHIFLLGIKEGSFPGKFKEDPILLDHEREKINVETSGTLKTAKERNREVTGSLEMTIACAEKGWVGSFPAMDLISGDEEFPSFYLVDVVRQIEEKNAISQDVYQDKLRKVRVPWALERSDQCLDPLEWSLHHLMNGTKGFIDHMMKKHGAPLAHVKTHSAYWGTRFNEYTGFIEMDGRKEPSGPGRFSATQLEGFMKCPYRWFIERRLGVRALEEPETIEKPGPMVIGSILHNVLETYMSETKDPKHDLKRLDRILTQVIDTEVAATGDIAPIYLEKLKKDLGALTGTFLEHTDEYLQDGRKPMFFEFAFGDVHKETIRDKPVALKIGKHKILLSGSIDRIDIKEDSAFILDYKNSDPKNYKTVEFMQGQRLQPALYAEAFMALKGKDLGIKEVNAGYLPLKGNAKEFVSPHDKDRKEKLGKIMDFILGAMKAGYFFPTGNCDWCDYGNICGKGIALAVSRKMKNATKDEKTMKLAKSFKSFEDF